jgi:hypothetical protein
MYKFVVDWYSSSTQEAVYMSHQMAAVEEFTLQHQLTATLHSKKNPDKLTDSMEQRLS